MPWSRILLSVVALSVYGDLEAGVIAHWRFEEGTDGTNASGSGSILDSSGNNLHLSPVNVARYVGVSNPASSLGMEFFGGSPYGYLTRSDSAAFNTTSLTIEAYVNIEAATGLRQILFRGNSLGGRDPYYLAVHNGRLRLNVSDGIVDRAVESSTLLPLNKTIHVAGTLDHATDELKVFVDGVLVGTSLAGGVRPDTLLANSQISLGAIFDGVGRGQYFDGVIDEVRISDTALTPSQFLPAPGSQVVPEPASLIALAGLFGLATIVRRRNNRRRWTS